MPAQPDENSGEALPPERNATHITVTIKHTAQGHQALYHSLGYTTKEIIPDDLTDETNLRCIKDRFIRYHGAEHTRVHIYIETEPPVMEIIVT